mmetsp:Transcript_35400/g.85463  ORF Transcript_35400/g.85463 Transcript_35400/m.85463 type:complete len:1276 (+) Transcript_35400:192-4019(+)
MASQNRAVWPSNEGGQQSGAYGHTNGDAATITKHKFLRPLPVDRSPKKRATKEKDDKDKEDKEKWQKAHTEWARRVILDMHLDFERQEQNQSTYTKIRRWLFYKEDLQTQLEMLRHHGRAKQTHHPFWKFVKAWAQAKLNDNDKNSSKARWDKGQDTPDKLAEFLFELEKSNNEYHNKKQVDDHMLNISGAQMIHLYFLMTNSDSYNRYQKERIKSLGQRIIEVGKKKNPLTDYINTPYASDLDVWSLTLAHVTLHHKKDDGLMKAIEKMKKRLIRVRKGIKRLKESGCIDKKKTMGLYTGETVLHFAIANADVETVRWLVCNGANVRAKATGSFFSPASLRWGHLRKIIHNKQENHMLSFNWWQLLPLTSTMYLPDATAPWTNDFGAIQSTGEMEKRAVSPDLYCGQLPLALAVQIGSIKICEELKKNTERMQKSNKSPRKGSKHRASLSDALDASSGANLTGKAKKQAQERQSSWHEIVTEKDDYGNTALHMAVMHSRKDAFDWLINNGAAKCINMFNDQALTPFTLAVWLGDVVMYTHIARKHLAINVWKYGETTSLRLIDLEQIDTFRVKYSKLHGETRERKGFRSAFELMVQHEVKAFAKERIFNSLVREKWKSFGKHSYIVWVVIPYAINLIFYSTAAALRAEELKRADWNSCASDLTNITGILFIIIASLGSAMQLWMTFMFRSIFRSSSANKNSYTLNALASREAFMMFTYRNLGSTTCLLLCGLFIAIIVARSACNRLLELQLIGVAAIFLWSNFLNALLLFKFIGTLVQTIYRMLFGDVLRFLVVYIILLGGFAFAFYAWMQKTRVHELDCIDGLTCPNLEVAQSPLKAALMLLWSSFGDVDIMDTIDDSESYEFMLIAQLTWIVLTNVLLLNLLISMMAETFSRDQQDTHDTWLFPIARFVLMWEKTFLLERQKERYRSGVIGPPKEFKELEDKEQGEESSDSESSDNEDEDPAKNPQEEDDVLKWYKDKADEISKAKAKRKVEHRYTALSPGTAETDEADPVIESWEEGDRWADLPGWFRDQAKKVCPNRRLPRMWRVAVQLMTKPMEVSSESDFFYFQIRPNISGRPLCMCSREMMMLPQAESYHVHQEHPILFCVDTVADEVYCTCKDPDCIQYMLSMKDKLYAKARLMGGKEVLSDLDYLQSKTTEQPYPKQFEQFKQWLNETSDDKSMDDQKEEGQGEPRDKKKPLVVSHQHRVLSSSGQRVWLKLNEDIMRHWVESRTQNPRPKTTQPGNDPLQSRTQSTISVSSTTAGGTPTSQRNR